MSDVNMKLVKELREKTAVGLMDCRKALIEADGDVQKAIDILRKKGAAVAAKRSDQATNQGVIAAHIIDNHQSGSLVEIACETDFAANTADMQSFVKSVAQVAEEIGTNVNSDALMADTRVKQNLDELMAKITENIKVSNSVCYQTDAHGFVQAYIHPGAHLGVLVEISSDKDISAAREDLARVAKDICMQVAVTNPVAIDPSGVDQALIDKEKEIYTDQLKAAGKPVEMIDKIMIGKINKYYEEVCLLNQKFIKDEKKSIANFLKECGDKHGLTLSIARFTRFAIGK